jgi:hypothetical protein
MNYAGIINPYNTKRMPWLSYKINYDIYHPPRVLSANIYSTTHVIDVLCRHFDLRFFERNNSFFELADMFACCSAVT